jgi:hypothetical protein
MEYHTLRVCSQCHVNVEAFKLPEHMVSPKNCIDFKKYLKIGAAI